MTTDLSSKTVEELKKEMFPGDKANSCWSADEIFDELAHRLEEAQQKIVAQQAMIEELKHAESCPYCANNGEYVRPDLRTGEPIQEQCQWCYETQNSVFNLVSKNDDLSALATALTLAKAEALEWAAQLSENNLRDFCKISGISYEHMEHHSMYKSIEAMRAAAAEYRAKAGRKE